MVQKIRTLRNRDEFFFKCSAIYKREPAVHSPKKGADTKSGWLVIQTIPAKAVRGRSINRKRRVFSGLFSGRIRKRANVGTKKYSTRG